VPLVPWLLIRSFIFRARNTSFRGLHFNFLGTYKGFCKAFRAYILFAILIIVLGGISEFAKSPEPPQEEASVADILADKGTSDRTDEGDGMVIFDEAEDEDGSVIFDGTADDNDGIIYDAEEKEKEKPKAFVGLFIFVLFLALFFLIPPAFTCTFKRFQMGHFAFGASRFQIQCRLSSFYGLYLRAFSPLLALIGVGVAIGVFLASTPWDEKSIVAGVLLIAGIAGALLFYAILLITQPCLNALIHNQVWNHTCLENHRFVSDQKLGGIIQIVLTNWLLILLTAGLYWPWAKVRMTAYRASHTAVLVDGDIDHFIAGASQEKGAIGEEIADIFDFDLAI